MSQHLHHRLFVFASFFFVSAQTFFLAPYRTRTKPSVAGALFATSVKRQVVCFYSPNFHRHVVAVFDGQNYTHVLESFLFLDEAEEKYPNAQRVATRNLPGLETVMGLGLEGPDDYQDACERFPPGEMIPATIPSAFPTTSLHAVIEKLSTILGSPFTSFFPEEEHDLVFERIRFLLAPIPEVKKDLDVPKIFFEGYGAGFSEKQVTSAILALTHLLPASPVAALIKRPPSTYFFGALGVSVQQLNEARNSLDGWLDRECDEDAASFAYLKMLGVSWNQCDLVLQAFSTSVISCELERTWETFHRSSSLSKSSIDYLQARLRLPPSEILNMMKVHPPLSSYNVRLLQKHSDALQSSLGLSSRGLKDLAVGCPSVLGISEVKARSRADFLRQRLHLSPSEIHKVIKRVPSILQYSLERNLEPKIEFLTSKAGLSGQNLTKAVVASPYVLGLSLEKSLKPRVMGLRERCDLSAEELGHVLMRSTQLLTSNWKTNLEPKIDFLVHRLGLNQSSLKQMVMSSPQILMQSVVTSLEPKLRVLEGAADGDKAIVSQVVQENPSLLVYSNPKLAKRVGMFKFRNVTFVEAFSPGRRSAVGESGNTQKPLTRRLKSVLEIASDGSVVQTWPDVQAAALSAGTSRANMYHILKTGRQYNGRKYIYGSVPEIPDVDTRSDSNVDFVESSGKDPRKRVIPDQGDKSLCLGAILQDSALYSDEQSSRSTIGKNSSGINLSVFVSSGVYPAKRRTRTTAGGLLMYFPQLADNHAAGKLLKIAIEKSIPYQVIPPSENGTNYHGGTVLSTFPASKPSRNRCGLFVCRSAFRVVLELLALDPTFTDLDVEVDVITDSNYIWELLGDPVALLQWGSYSRAKDFVYEGPEPLWRVHSDILYPLARTYYRMRNQMLATPALGERTKPVAKSLMIRFRHESELAWTREDSQIRKGRKLARTAAKWQFDREINAL